MKPTRKQIASCNTLEGLVELHAKAFYMQPDYNKGRSIQFAAKVIQGRNNRVVRVKEVSPHWND